MARCFYSHAFELGRPFGPSKKAFLNFSSRAALLGKEKWAQP